MKKFIFLLLLKSLYITYACFRHVCVLQGNILSTVYLMDWSHGAESWIGVMEWSHGLESWTGVMDWSHGEESWIGVME